MRRLALVAGMATVEVDGDPGYGKLRGSLANETAVKVAVHGTGLVYVVGKTTTVATDGVLLMQFDQSNPGANPDNHRWTSIEGIGFGLSVAGIATRPGDAIFVTGSVAQGPGAPSEDVFILKYDREGNLKD